GLAEAVKKQAAEIAIPGQGNDKKSGFGPVISKAAQERIISWIDEAEKMGAKVVLDGRKQTVEGYDGGYWLGPTILEDVPLEAKAY
ncbi:aldehyde dehydrogenase family protein, partial [Actinotignum timonense]